MMKSLFSLILLLAFSVNASAYDFKVDGLCYDICSGGDSVIVTFESISYFSMNYDLKGDIVIPEKVKHNGKSYAVVRIGCNAFLDCTGLKSVSIPNSVTEIGSDAFSGCTGLTSVNIPNSVTEISERAFAGCTGLTSVNIPNSVTEISERAFAGCTGLTSVNIPNSVTEISERAFAGCTGLTSVIIPNSVTMIGQGAFKNCKNLSAIMIPSSVISIDGLTFAGCTNLVSIIVEPSNPIFDSRENCNAIIETATNSLIVGCKNTIIPSTIKTIGWGAFAGFSAMKSVTIPNSVTEIGSDAFSGCTGLTSVIIPNSVKVIRGFSGCTGLTSVTIPNSVTEIGDDAFNGCTGLTSVTIPNSVTSIGSRAFEDCISLASVIIPESVSEIVYSTFRGCTSLASVTLPNSLTVIGNYAFLGCKGLTSVTIPSSVSKIDYGAFTGCTSLTSVNIPKSVTVIGDYAFNGCSGLTSVDIPNSVTMIGNVAFANCTSLTSVTVPSSLASIGYDTFTGCTSLKSVTIPNSIIEISNSAFRGCTHLSSINSMIIEPQHVVFIDDLSIYNDKNATKMEVFKDVNKDSCTLYVPLGKSSLYNNTSPWYAFTTIIEKDFGIINENTVSTSLPKPRRSSGSSEYEYQQELSNHSEEILQNPEVRTNPENLYDILPLASSCEDANEYDKAIKLYEAAIDIISKNNIEVLNVVVGFSNMTDEFHSPLTLIYRRIGNCYYQLKDYQQALNHYELAIESCDIMSYKSAKVYMEMSRCYYHMQDYTQAIEHYKAACDIYKMNGNIRVEAYTHDVIGYIYFQKQEYNQAINHYKTAIDLYRRSSEDSSEYYGKSFEPFALREKTEEYILEKYELIGYCYFQQHDYAQAIDYYKTALEIYKTEQVSSKEAEMHECIGYCYFQQHDYDQAQRHFDAAIELGEVQSTIETIEYYSSHMKEFIYGIGWLPAVEVDHTKGKARVYEKKGRCYFATHDLARALDNYKKAWRLYDVFPYSNHEDLLCQLCEDISYCQLSPEDCKSVYEIFRETVDLKHERIFSYFVNNNAKARAQNWMSVSRLFQDYYPAVTIGAYEYCRNEFYNRGLDPWLDGLFYKDLMDQLYNKSALFAKGLLLTSENELRRIILDNGNPNVISKYQELLEKSDETLEAELREISMEHDDFMKNLRLKWTDVQQKLGDNDVAVEFLSFPKFGTDSVVYIALTVRKDYDQPHMTVLCTESEIDAVKDDAYTSSKLSKLIWGRLSEELNVDSVKSVYFSPSGELYNIAIESMPHWADGNKTMSEVYNMYRLSSTRELALKRTSVDGASGATVYGGISYDVPYEALSSTRHNSPATEDSALAYIPPQGLMPSKSTTRAYEIVKRSDGTRGFVWDTLKYAKEEAYKISSLLSNKGENVSLKTDTVATETSFKDLSGQKRSIIHIVTHGFYWNDSTAISNRKMSFISADYERLQEQDKSMMRAGLLFAGAQNAFSGKTAPSGIDDGILTAQEVANLDLRGLDLLVLSACQTGLGAVTGDGVFGLQRGFKKAGAQSIIMSLWEVSDEATRLMMESFYTGLTQGMTKRQAFLEAQKSLRGNKKYGIYNDKEHEEPTDKPHWAAFILLDALE